MVDEVRRKRLRIRTEETGPYYFKLWSDLTEEQIVSIEGIASVAPCDDGECFVVTVPHRSVGEIKWELAWLAFEDRGKIQED